MMYYITMYGEKKFNSEKFFYVCYLK